MKRYVFGVDIGGTKIAVVLADDKGVILAKETFPSNQDHPHPVLDTIALIIRDMIASIKIKDTAILGVGVSYAGPISQEDPTILIVPNMKGWKGINLRDELRRRLVSLPVVCENDANAAAVAEKMFGNGQTAKSFVYVTISTGVGAGIIINDNVVSGASLCGGEFGHIPVLLGGPVCGCGKQGCLEALSSGTAVAKMAQDVKKQRNISDYESEHAFKVYRKLVPRFSLKQKTAIIFLTVITAKEISVCAKKGDRISAYLIWRAGYYCGVGFSTMMQLINPEMIAYGGSVVKAGKFFVDGLRCASKEHAWQLARSGCEIKKALLGDVVADLGAVSVALLRIKE